MNLRISVSTVGLLFTLSLGPAALGQDAKASSPLLTTAAGLPQIHPFDRHRFSMDGDVWFPLGFYGGSMANTANEPQWKGSPEVAFGYYLATISALDLNFFRAWINWGASRPVRIGTEVVKVNSDWDYHMVHPYLRAENEMRDEDGDGIPGEINCCAADGGNQFDLDAFNPAYFSMIERLVENAKRNGLVAQLILFDCWHVHNDHGSRDQNGKIWPTIEHDYYSYWIDDNGNHHSNNVNNAAASDGGDWTRGGTTNPAANEPPHVTFQRNFINKVLDTLPVSEHPNIIWETCNENRDDGNFDDFVERVIRARDSSRLVMPADLPEHRDVPGYTTPEIHQTPTQSEDSIVAMHDSLKMGHAAQVKPLITDNDVSAEPSHIDAAFRRKKAWAALTAGAHTDYFIDNLPAHQASMDDPDVVASMYQFGKILDLLETKQPNLLGAVPADDKVSTGNWAYGRPGEEYIAYLPEGGSITISDLPQRFAATWFNPRSGAMYQSDETGPTVTLNPPSEPNLDWALHVRCGNGSWNPAPFQSIAVPPARLEAENFDCGGQGVGFSDTDIQNHGSAYRSTAVDIVASTDVGGGYVVGWINAGEWLGFSMTTCSSNGPCSPGTYQPQLRVAGPGQGGRIKLELLVNGQSVGQIETAATSGYEDWKTVVGPEFALNFGTQWLQVKAITGNFNLNWIDVNAATTQPVGAFISDRFSNTSTIRELGDPLNATVTELGARTWAATSGFGFSANVVTNLSPSSSVIANVPFTSADFTQRNAAVEALVDTSLSDWVGIGFSNSAAGGYWSSGQVWAFLRNNGLLQVKANGTTHDLYAGYPSAYRSGVMNRLKVEYDILSKEVKVRLNDSLVTLTVSDLDAFGFTPNVTHVGVHAFKQAGLAIGAAFVDDFSVKLSGGSGQPGHSLIASYLPVGGGARTTFTSTSATPPALRFYYDESLGNFEQRIGGACYDGYSNPGYLTVRYSGEGIDSCSFRADWDAAPIACTPAHVAALLSGAEITISTDDYGISPETCRRAIPLVPRVRRNETHYFELNIVRGGQSFTRRVNFIQDNVSPPYLRWVGSYVTTLGGQRTETISSVSTLEPFGFYFKQSLGSFEQRPGGRCPISPENPTYLKVHFEGEAFNSCTFQSSLDSAPIACPADLVTALMAGAEITINADQFQTAPGGCPLQFTTQTQMAQNQQHWIRLNLVKNGVTYVRQLNYFRTNAQQ